MKYWHEMAKDKELPPRARRIPEASAIRRCAAGTTSACAENTLFGQVFSGKNGNYLRMRGEYLALPPIRVSRRELPPHARRILAGEAQRRTNQGTTSACAENTFW